MTTATTTTTPLINDLIGWIGKNNRAARAARLLVQFFDVVCQTTAWNFHFLSSKSLILYLCMKPIRAKKAKVLLAYFVHRDQLGIIAKHLTQCKVLF